MKDVLGGLLVLAIVIGIIRFSISSIWARHSVAHKVRRDIRWDRRLNGMFVKLCIAAFFAAAALVIGDYLGLVDMENILK